MEVLELAEDLATGDFFERYPSLLEGELQDRGLWPLGQNARADLRVAYNARRRVLHEEARLRAEWQAARREAADIRSGKG